MKKFIEKLIGRLEEKAFEVQLKQGIKHPSTHDMFLEKFSVREIEEIVNQLAEEHNNGWIPCSERLPEDGHDYLICDDKGNVYSSSYYNNRWLVNCITNEVIAWQPLPAPYQPKGE